MNEHPDDYGICAIPLADQFPCDSWAPKPHRTRTSAEWLTLMRAENAERAKRPIVYHSRPPVCGGDVWTALCGVDLMDKGGPVSNAPSYGEPVTCHDCLAAMHRGRP